MVTDSCPRSSDCVCFEFALEFRDCVSVSRLRLCFATALMFRDCVNVSFSRELMAALKFVTVSQLYGCP